MSSMDEAYAASGRRQHEARLALETETDPAERERLERIIVHEQWVWN